MFPRCLFETSPPTTLDSTHETVNHIYVNEYSPPDFQLEDITRNFTDTHWTEGPLPAIAQPSSPTYESVLRREMETLFGTTSSCVTAGVLMTPSDMTFVMEDHGFISEAAQSAAVNLHTTPPPTAHSCLETLPCQWASEDNSETCGVQVTCNSVPAHFRNMHGIKKLQADVPIFCLWKGCPKQIKRKYFVRHIRECHLDHRREKRGRS